MVDIDYEPPVQKPKNGNVCIPEPTKTGMQVGVGVGGVALAADVLIAHEIVSSVNPLLALLPLGAGVWGMNKIGDIPTCETPDSLGNTRTIPAPIVEIKQPPPAAKPLPRSPSRFPYSDHPENYVPPPPILEPISLNSKKTDASIT